MSELESDDGYDFYGSGRSERYSESESDDLQEEEYEGVRARHAQDNGDSDHVVPPTLQMCSKHKPGCMIEICIVCSAALTMVRPEVAKQLIAPGSVVAPQPSALTRYPGRSDEKPPTLVFSEASLERAFKTFTQGRFRGKEGSEESLIFMILLRSF